MQQQLVSNLSQQMFIIAVTMVVLGVLNVIYYWSRLDHTVLVLWAVALLGINLIRLFLNMLYVHYTTERLQPGQWLSLFAFVSAVSGLTWSAMAIHAVRHLPLEACNLLFITMVGMVGGSIATNSSSARVFVSYIVAVLLPISLVLLLVDSLEYRIYGAAGLLGMILVTISFLQVNAVIKRSILRGIENEMLLKDLEARQEQVVELNGRLLEQSSTDFLTDLSNRRIFDEEFRMAWTRAVDQGSPISLILLDIDCFKLYNDTSGHQAGDACLKRVASLLQSCGRDVQIQVARYGGEEFAVVLLGHDIDSAESVALAMKHAVFAEKMPHGASTVNEYVTLSAGVATMMPTDSDSSDRLISLTDAALYRAKQTGRNRVVRGFYSGTDADL